MIYNRKPKDTEELVLRIEDLFDRVNMHLYADSGNRTKLFQELDFNLKLYHKETGSPFKKTRNQERTMVHGTGLF